MGRLVWSETILDAARQVRQQVEDELSRAGITGDVFVTGPASMPGVLTKGDLDLHLRVPAVGFDSAVRGLRELYAAVSPDSWAPSLAVFEIPATHCAGLAVTPIGSVHDRRFTSSWRRLAAEPDLLRAYNALKSDFFGTPEYEQHKSAFFDMIADA